jgi:hypothetical protein
MNFFCLAPWLQPGFSEKPVMEAGSRYRKHGAQRYEEVESVRNRRSLRRFEQLVARSSLQPERVKYRGVKRRHFLTRMP